MVNVCKYAIHGVSGIFQELRLVGPKKLATADALNRAISKSSQSSHQPIPGPSYMDPKALRRDADRGQAAWDLKVQELADRGICLCQLLDFYALLGKSVMPGFHPARSTTNDVVRQAIIPLSAPSQRSEHGQAYACKVGEEETSCHGL